MERLNMKSSFVERSMRKRKVLVFTSTFPRWGNDTTPGFVWVSGRELTGKSN